MNSYNERAWKAFDTLPDGVWNKVKCHLKHGCRVYWHFKDDAEFAKKCKTAAKKQKPFGGIVLALEDVEPSKELEIEETLVVMDRYPSEKENCTATYFPLTELLADEELMEIYD